MNTMCQEQCCSNPGLPQLICITPVRTTTGVDGTIGSILHVELAVHREKPAAFTFAVLNSG